MTENLTATCAACGKSGKICVDMVITGSRHVVHMGRCHDALIKRETEEKRVGKMIDGIVEERAQ